MTLPVPATPPLPATLSLRPWPVSADGRPGSPVVQQRHCKPLSAILTLLDCSAALQLEQRNQMVRNQAAILSHSLRGIETERSAQIKGFALNICGHAIGLIGGAAGMVTSGLHKPVLRQCKQGFAKIKGFSFNNAGQRGGNARPSAPSVLATVTPKNKVDPSLINARVQSSLAVTSSTSGILSASGNHIAKMGELDRGIQDAYARRISLKNDLEQSLANEHNSNMRESRDLIRSFASSLRYQA